jgi:hypothetical protein
MAINHKMGGGESVCNLFFANENLERRGEVEIGCYLTTLPINTSQKKTSIIPSGSYLYLWW